MKNPLFSRFIAPLALATVFAGAAAAGPITLTTGSWQTEPFTQMNSGDFFPTAYQAPTGEVIDITGYYVTGDYYKVYVNGVLALTTTQVGPLNVDYGDQNPPLYTDPASAFSSGLFSTAQFRVNAGDLITIADLYPPSGIGEVGIQAVPEPSAWTLLPLGLLVLLLHRHRRYSFRIPRIRDRQAQTCEVFHVARGDTDAMFLCGRGDHSIHDGQRDTLLLCVRS